MILQPATIGYAVGASPLSLLAYIGEMILAWSDPRSIALDDVLATISIYYLTGCFHTSVMIYHQTQTKRAQLESRESWGKIKSKMAYSLFVRTYPSPPIISIIDRIIRQPYERVYAVSHPQDCRGTNSNFSVCSPAAPRMLAKCGPLVEYYSTFFRYCLRLK